jgi:hypothetical protein
MLPIRAIPRLCISSQHESFRLSQHSLSAILRTNLPSTTIIEFCITGNRTLVLITNICQQLNKLCLNKPILYLYMPNHHHYHQKSHSIHPSHQPHTPNHKHGNRPHQPTRPLVLLTARQNHSRARKRRCLYVYCTLTLFCLAKMVSMKTDIFDSSRSAETRIRRRDCGKRECVFRGLSQPAEKGGV